MSYILGLDVGITSVGWSILAIDEVGEPYKIQDLGVRIFERAENPKDGAALALPRREARGSRRRLRRRRHRKERIRQLLLREGVIKQEELTALYDGATLTDIYTIRYEALERMLTAEEWTRLLIHLAQRRGFRSNRKKQTTKEDGKLLEAMKNNDALLLEKGYRTVGEMFYKDEKFLAHKRNTTDDYLCTVSRGQMEQEIQLLFRLQRELGNPHATEHLEATYTAIYFAQRSFDQGPGGNSPYANPLAQMIGDCTFEKGEKRAVKASYSFEYFRLLTQINAITIQLATGGKRKVTVEEKEAIIQLAHRKSPIKYTDVRKAIELEESDHFKAVYVGGQKTVKEVEDKVIFAKMDAYHTLRKALDSIAKNYIQQVTWEQRDCIAYATTLYKTDENVESYLKKQGISAEVIEAVSGLSFSQVGHLSLKAMGNIIPYLEEGMVYSEACACAGYNFNHAELPATKKEFIESVTNPVVRRGISQSIKVVEAIIRKYGAPAKVHIELAREMGRNFADRKKIEKSQEENRGQNERLVKEIQSTYGVHKVNGQMLLKYKLWKEQGGWCIYSGSYIAPDRLFSDMTYTDIDHIIPYSKCFDDSYVNKVLVLSSENRQKGNKTPFEYFGKDEERWRLYEERVRTGHFKFLKQQRLLKKHIEEEDEAGFKERNLNDTRYITKLLSEYIRQKITFDEGYTFKKRVVNVNGGITAYCRKRWGLTKVREDGDLHHALDATVIAAVTDGMIQKITKYHQIREDERLQAMAFPPPWLHFRDELEARMQEDPNIMLANCNIPHYEGQQIEPIFVSRMPRRKSTGQAHKETLKGGKLREEGYTISRVPITSLELDKDGEIKGYYNKEANIGLYAALRGQLAQYGGKGSIAFTTPFYKPQAPGKPPIEVKRVKVVEKATITVPLDGGKSAAANGSMVRIDVFTKKEKYYLVPIYMNDVVRGVLPNKAIVAKREYREWIEMDVTYQFLFSVYPNDLLYIKHPREIKLVAKDKATLKVQEGLFYYKGAHSGTGAINCIRPDGKYIVEGIGVQRLLALYKYEVDILGNRTRVKKEIRRGYGKDNRK